jgi:hypothetical protein
MYVLRLSVAGIPLWYRSYVTGLWPGIQVMTSSLIKHPYFYRYFFCRNGATQENHLRRQNDNDNFGSIHFYNSLLLYKVKRESVLCTFGCSRPILDDVLMTSTCSFSLLGGLSSVYWNSSSHLGSLFFFTCCKNKRQSY